MARCALFSALMCLCAWISFPFGESAITLQTFALFLTLELLGGKYGSLVCLVYLLLGAVGLPVFSGFRGGFGMLLGTTGGYLWGFLLCALLYWLITALLGKGFPVRLVTYLAGLLLCYALGTFWFYCVYLQAGSALSIGFVLLKCVVPFVLPDLLKLSLALALAKKTKRFLTA
jgi:biotin transport system substrate-specific component